MQQEQARTAKPRMRRSLLHDPSKLPAFRARKQAPLDTKTVRAEPTRQQEGDVASRAAPEQTAVERTEKAQSSLRAVSTGQEKGNATSRKAPEQKAVVQTGSAQSSLARRLYTAATAPLAARTDPDPDDELSAHLPEHVVGKGLKVLGHIVSDGEVAVLGEVQGNVYCKSLLVGRKARIVGDVIAKEVVVQGRIIGKIHAERLTLKSTCYVVGEIHHHAVKIEQGACFEGKSRRSERSISIAAISASLSEPRDPDVEFANCDAGEQVSLLAA